jgi:RNA polymerase sigma-70 factor, ECF subfamily
MAAIAWTIGSEQAPRLLYSVQNSVAELRFDQDFLTALKDRDEDAENFLISHFSRPVRLKLHGRLHSPELIQDAYQETFLRVLSYFRSGRTLDNPASLPGFVHTMCHNIALEFLRGHTRHPQVPENHPEAKDDAPGPERQAIAGERIEFARRVLEELPEKDRRILRRVFLDEEDKDRVCEEFNVDRQYLRVLLHRARNRFRAAALKTYAATG